MLTQVTVTFALRIWVIVRLFALLAKSHFFGNADGAMLKEYRVDGGNGALSVYSCRVSGIFRLYYRPG